MIHFIHFNRSEATAQGLKLTPNCQETALHITFTVSLPFSPDIPTFKITSG